MGVVHRPVVQQSLGVERQYAVGARGVGDPGDRAARGRPAQQRRLGRGVLQAHLAPAVRGHEALVARRGRNRGDRCGVRCHHVDAAERQLGRVVPVADLKPDGHAAGVVAHDQRPVADQPRHGAHRLAGCAAAGQARGQFRRRRVADVPVQHFAGYDRGEEIPLLGVERQRGHVGVQVGRQVGAVFHDRGLAQERLLLAARDEQQRARPDHPGRADPLPVLVQAGVHHAVQGAAVRVENDRVVFGDVRGRDAGRALEGDRKRNAQRNHAAVVRTQRRGMRQVPIVDRGGRATVQPRDGNPLDRPAVGQRDKIDAARGGDGVGDFPVLVDAERERFHGGRAVRFPYADQVGQPCRWADEFRARRLPQRQGLHHDDEQDRQDAEDHGEAAERDGGRGRLVRDVLPPDAAPILGLRQPHPSPDRNRTSAGPFIGRGRRFLYVVNLRHAGRDLRFVVSAEAQLISRRSPVRAGGRLCASRSPAVGVPQFVISGPMQ